MKVCIKCNKTKSETDFYGGQGDCKECTKKRVKERQDALREDPAWVEKEKERHRLKYHRLGYKDLHKPTPEKKKEIIKRYKEKYPEKQLAKQSSNSLTPEIKGNNLHHWSYNEEHWKDVIELSVENHNIAHRYITYDQERMMYRNLSGILLDTKESHIEYINQFFKP